MLSLMLDSDLERLLERDVDDLARYNILRFLHDSPEVCEGVEYYADRLGLRSTERVGEALDALASRGLLNKAPTPGTAGWCYSLSRDPRAVDIVERLYRLSSTEFYGELVERLAARSLHRARRAQPLPRAERHD